MKVERYSVYTLTCPVDGQIKYVGISTNLAKRYVAHVINPGATTREWVLSLGLDGFFPIMKEVFAGKTKITAFKLEKSLVEKIEKSKGGLLNKNYNPSYTKKIIKHLPPIEYLTPINRKVIG